MARASAARKREPVTQIRPSGSVSSRARTSARRAREQGAQCTGQGQDLFGDHFRRHGAAGSPRTGSR